MTPDTLTDYIKAIDRFPLLTSEQELSLAAEMQALVKLVGMPSEVDFNSLDRTQFTTEQNNIIDTGLKAYKTLTESNLRLVIKFSKVYRNRGLDFLCLIQHGNMGLMHAIEKFDPDKQYRFSTYAYWWIKQYLQRSVTNFSRAIRLPINISDNLDKINRERNNYFVLYGRMPSMAVLAKKCKLTKKELRHTLDSDRGFISLNLYFKDDNHTLEEVIPDTHPVPSLEDTEHNEEHLAVRRVLAGLTPHECNIVELYHGLYTNAHTAREIADLVGLNKKQVNGVIEYFKNQVKLEILPF